jgi:hypothetical protein
MFPCRTSLRRSSMARISRPATTQMIACRMLRSEKPALSDLLSPHLASKALAPVSTSGGVSAVDHRDAVARNPY